MCGNGPERPGPGSMPEALRRNAFAAGGLQVDDAAVSPAAIDAAAPLSAPAARTTRVSA